MPDAKIATLLALDAGPRPRSGPWRPPSTRPRCSPSTATRTSWPPSKGRETTSSTRAAATQPSICWNARWRSWRDRSGKGVRERHGSDQFGDPGPARGRGPRGLHAQRLPGHVQAPDAVPTPVRGETTFVDGTDTEAVARALPGAKLLYLENPSSLTFDLQDVQALTEAARDQGVATIIDNSWALTSLPAAHRHGRRPRRPLRQQVHLRALRRGRRHRRRQRRPRLADLLALGVRRAWARSSRRSMPGSWYAV